MTQANDVLDTLEHTEGEFDLLLDEEGDQEGRDATDDAGRGRHASATRLSALTTPT